MDKIYPLLPSIITDTDEIDIEREAEPGEIEARQGADRSGGRGRSVLLFSDFAGS
jgi:hypothetical protein